MTDPQPTPGVYQKMIGEGRVVGGWQPFETAPRDGTLMLAVSKVFGDQVYSMIHWSDRRGAFVDGLTVLDRWPTHWQPLPAPPAHLPTPETAS